MLLSESGKKKMPNPQSKPSKNTSQKQEKSFELTENKFNKFWHVTSSQAILSKSRSEIKFQLISESYKLSLPLLGLISPFLLENQYPLLSTPIPFQIPEPLIRNVDQIFY